MSYGVNILVQQRQCGISLWGQGPKADTPIPTPSPDGTRTGSQHSSLTQPRTRPNFRPRSRNCCSRSKTGAIGAVGCR
jgi:hypothetical protein